MLSTSDGFGSGIGKVSERNRRGRYHPGEPQRLDRHTPGAHSGIARDNAAAGAASRAPGDPTGMPPALRPAAVTRPRVRMPSGIGVVGGWGRKSSLSRNVLI